MGSNSLGWAVALGRWADLVSGLVNAGPSPDIPHWPLGLPGLGRADHHTARADGWLSERTQHASGSQLSGVTFISLLIFSSIKISLLILFPHKIIIKVAQKTNNNNKSLILFAC
jgi:hypothetical protein